jgi:hypothetical protein
LADTTATKEQEIGLAAARGRCPFDGRRCAPLCKEIDASVAPISGSLQWKSNLFLFQTDMVPKFIAKDQQKKIP